MKRRSLFSALVLAPLAKLFGVKRDWEVSEKFEGVIKWRNGYLLHSHKAFEQMVKNLEKNVSDVWENS